MGLINVYNTIDNKSTTFKANGKLKDILPEISFKNSLVLKAGNRLDENYEVTEEDVLYVREVPHALSALAITAIVTVTVVAVGGVVGAVVYANMKSKEAQAEMEKAQRNANNLAAQTQQLPFIRGAKNRSALGEAVQFVMGSVYNTPYNLTSGFYSIGGTDGVDSYYNAVFSLGYNKQKVTEILLGNESICKRENGITGELPFDETSLYYEDNESRIEVREPGQALTLTNCNQKVDSTYSGTELKHDFGEDAEPVIVQAAENAMKIQVCIQFSSLREYDPDGEVWGTRTATVVPSWSNDSGETWHTFTFAGSNNNTFVKNANKNIRFVAEKTFTASESYGKSISIKVEKTTPKKESNTQEDCCLLWYQTFCYDAQKSTSSRLVACQLVEEELYNKTQKVAYRIKSNDNTQDMLDELHCMTEGLARTWNGSVWSSEKTATRNPASWLLEVLTSSVHNPSRFVDSELDLQSFGALYEYCEDEDFYCDGIISKGETKKAVIEKILTLCNATLIINNEGLYEVCIDKEEETPVALLNTENIVSFTFSKSLAKKTDGTKVTFTNRDSWSVDSFYSMLDGGDYDYENDTVDTLAIDYATTHSHAYKIAQRTLRQRQLQPREIKVDVGHEGDYYPLYSTVLLQLPHLLQGLNSSVIKAISYNENNQITAIQISDLVTFENGTRYGVIIQATNEYGHRFLQGEVTGSGETRELEFLTPLELGESLIVPERGNHLSFGTLDENGRFSKITNVMKIYGIEPNGKDGYSLILKDYNEEIYSYGGTIPEYKSNVTKPQAKSKGVNIDDLNNLKNKVTMSSDSISELSERVEAVDSKASVWSSTATCDEATTSIAISSLSISSTDALRVDDSIIASGLMFHISAINETTVTVDFLFSCKGNDGKDGTTANENLLHDSKLLDKLFSSSYPYSISVDTGAHTANAFNGFTQTYWDNSNATDYKNVLMWSNIKNFTLGDKYTLSFWAKGNGKLYTYCSGNTGYVGAKRLATSDNQAPSLNFNDGNTTFSLTEDWTQYWVTWQLDSTGDTTISKNILLRAAAGAEVYIAGCKFEKGVTATAWCPHVDEYAGPRAIRYLGKYSSAPSDYITGDWYLNTTNGGVYYRTSSSWSEITWLNTTTEPDYRLLACIDDMLLLVDTVSTNTTMNNLVDKYIDTLLANTAFVNKLFAKKIKLVSSNDSAGAIYGGKYLADGSEDPNATTDKGVYMDSTGEFKASNGEFNGTIQVDNPVLDSTQLTYLGVYSSNFDNNNLKGFNLGSAPPRSGDYSYCYMDFLHLKQLSSWKKPNESFGSLVISGSPLTLSMLGFHTVQYFAYFYGSSNTLYNSLSRLFYYFQMVYRRAPDVWNFISFRFKYVTSSGTKEEFTFSYYCISDYNESNPETSFKIWFKDAFGKSGDHCLLATNSSCKVVDPITNVQVSDFSRMEEVEFGFYSY